MKIIVEINTDGAAFVDPATQAPSEHWLAFETAVLLRRFADKVVEQGVEHAVSVGCYDANGVKSLTARTVE